MIRVIAWGVCLCLALSPALLRADVCGPSAPKPWEKTAADELREYLSRAVPGGQLSVDGLTDVTFHVGDTAFAAEKGLLSGSFADEEWVIRSFGGDVVLNGGGTRGSLYAVYRFLEDFCGIRWWSDAEEDVPKHAALALSRLDLRGRPFFRFRDIYRGGTANHLVSLRNRLNAFSTQLPAKWGGGGEYGPPGHCHTWDRILPFAKYGSTHPAFYSLRDGTRVGGQEKGQLCLSNPELPAFFAARVEEMIAQGEASARANGTEPPRLYDISMNDNHFHCQCAACSASREQHGVSGDQLIFENKVAKILARRHPELLFSVFAYYEAEDVPKDATRAADNVLVKLCNTRQNMASGIFEPDNAFMREQVDKWSRHAKNLLVWDYSVTFYDKTLHCPFAGEFHFGDKLRHYADNGVKGLFIEHEHPDVADFHEVKFWVQAKLLEDPARDTRKLLNDALRRYYGSAAKNVARARQYLDRVTRERKAFIGWFPRPVSFAYLRDEDFSVLTALWDAAEDSVRDDPRRLARVRRSRRAFDRTRTDVAAARKMRRMSEAGVSDRPFVDIPAASGFFEPHATGLFKLVDDSEAAGGKAYFASFAASPHLALPMEMAVYLRESRRIVARKTWERAPGAGYQWYDLGEVDLRAPDYFITLTRSWCLSMTPPCLPELIGGPCRIKAHVKFGEAGVSIDRLVMIPSSDRYPVSTRENPLGVDAAGLEVVSGDVRLPGMDAEYDAATDTLVRFGGPTAVTNVDYLARRYDCALAPLNGRGVFKTPPVGWMTWYAVKFGANEETILENAKAFRAAFGAYMEERPVLWVDWEWQHRRFNSRGEDGEDALTPHAASYPRGLAALATDLRSLGFTPALWVAPQVDVRTNALLSAHPEWILASHPFWGGHVFVDPTASGCLENYVRMLFRTYRTWGYEAFKWDCLPYTMWMFDLYHDRFRDRRLSTKEAYRRLIAAGREAVGPEAYLESCSGTGDDPFLWSLDAFDGARVGGDVFSWASFAREGVDMLLRYYPLHNLVVRCDADSLVLREEFNTLEQARTRVTIAALTGVPITVGDRIDDLDEPRRAMLRKAMPVVPVRPASLRPYVRKGNVLALTAHFAREWGTWQVRSWSNLSTTETERVTCELPADAVVWDVWNERLVPTDEGGLSIELPPGVSRVVRVTRRAPIGPTLLGTTRHLTQGGYELESFAASATGAVWRHKTTDGGDERLYLLDGDRVVAVSSRRNRWSR